MTSPTTPPTICRARADHPPTKSAPTPLIPPGGRRRSAPGLRPDTCAIHTRLRRPALKSKIPQAPENLSAGRKNATDASTRAMASLDPGHKPAPRRTEGA